MEKLHSLDHDTQAAEGRREALSWLARRLEWEHRLGELRPGAKAEQKAA